MNLLGSDSLDPMSNDCVDVISYQITYFIEPNIKINSFEKKRQKSSINILLWYGWCHKYILPVWAGGGYTKSGDIACSRLITCMIRIKIAIKMNDTSWPGTDCL